METYTNTETKLVTNPLDCPALTTFVVNRDGDIDPDYLDLLERVQRSEAIHMAGKRVLQVLGASTKAIGSILVASFDKQIHA